MALDLVLVKHAHADYVPDESRPLSTHGAAAARQLVPILAATAPDALYSSPYSRARQTIEPLAEHLGMPIHEIDGFRERTLADGRVDDFDGALLASWQDLSLAFPGGESSLAAQKRVRAAYDELARRHDNDTVIVATHGNVFTLLLNTFDAGYHYDFWNALTFPDAFRVSMRSERIVSIERLWHDDQRGRA
jgi:2,3-bisphosphoglycerate-dependent phosphoglycerate mutase